MASAQSPRPPRRGRALLGLAPADRSACGPLGRSYCPSRATVTVATVSLHLWRGGRDARGRGEGEAWPGRPILAADVQGGEFGVRREPRRQSFGRVYERRLTGEVGRGQILLGFDPVRSKTPQATPSLSRDGASPGLAQVGCLLLMEYATEMSFSARRNAPERSAGRALSTAFSSAAASSAARPPLGARGPSRTSLSSAPTAPSLPGQRNSGRDVEASPGVDGSRPAGGRCRCCRIAGPPPLPQRPTLLPNNPRSQAHISTYVPRREAFLVHLDDATTSDDDEEGSRPAGGSGRATTADLRVTLSARGGRSKSGIRGGSGRAAPRPPAGPGLLRGRRPAALLDDASPSSTDDGTGGSSDDEYYTVGRGTVKASSAAFLEVAGRDRLGAHTAAVPVRGGKVGTAVPGLPLGGAPLGKVGAAPARARLASLGLNGQQHRR